MKRTLVTSLVMHLAVAFAWPAPVSAKMPETIRVGVDVDAGTLDPRLARDVTAARTIDLIYDGLVQLGPDLRPQPALATSWDNPSRRSGSSICARA
jgi:peptide/nickel transport system substrate-binding protein